jgi:hypothetical protein
MTNGFSRRLGSFVLPIGDENGPQNGQPTNELGYPSEMMMGYLPGWGAIDSVDELETNPKLTFPTSILTYHGMRTDPQVQGLLTGAIWPLLRMKWYINPNNAPDEMVEHIATDLNLPIIDPYAPPQIVVPQNTLDVKVGPKAPKPAVPGAAKPRDPNRDDPRRNNVQPMQPLIQKAPAEPFYRRRAQGRFNFLQHLEEALDAIAYGFEVFEQVGYIGKDGKFHYRKLATRPPQTITQINLARDGGIVDVRQGLLNDTPLDIGRLVVYSFQKRGANWHGRSLLRGCYEPWLLKDRAVRVGVMNIQRAGVGVPIANGPPGASDTDLKVLNNMMSRLVAGDRSGGAVPYGATVRLVGVEGGQPDTVGFIKLMNEEMARSFFQMFMQLGQTTSGSRALGTTFVEYHKLVTEYIAQWFAMIFNEHVIEDDIDWNWGPEEEYCPLLEWKWDTEGSDENPEGPAAAANPAQQHQDQVNAGHIQVDDETAHVVLS